MEGEDIGGADGQGRACELGEVVCGKAPGRVRADEVPLFKSNGLAIEDVAVAVKVLERVKAQGIGTEITLVP